MNWQVACNKNYAFLSPIEIQLGRDYLFAPINDFPTRARIVEITNNMFGNPALFTWREVLENGDLGKQRTTIAMFVDMPKRMTLKWRMSEQESGSVG